MKSDKEIEREINGIIVTGYSPEKLDPLTEEEDKLEVMDLEYALEYKDDLDSMVKELNPFQNTEEVAEAKGSIKGNGRRKYKVRPSGYTYPEANIRKGKRTRVRLK